MQTQLPILLLSTEQGREANAILRRCVHCGFCNATCPAYQLKGDELDGPRGRTYAILQAELSKILQGNKLDALQANSPSVIVSANVGCLLHLRQGAWERASQTSVPDPTKHWVEVLADCLEAG